MLRARPVHRRPAGSAPDAGHGHLRWPVPRLPEGRPGFLPQMHRDWLGRPGDGCGSLKARERTGCQGGQRPQGTERPVAERAPAVGPGPRSGPARGGFSIEK